VSNVHVASETALCIVMELEDEYYVHVVYWCHGSESLQKQL